MHLRTALRAPCILAFSYLIQAQTLSINNVGIIDMNTGRVRQSQNILIQGNTIVGIQNANNPSQAANNFDATGMVVMPGLVDMHTHLYFTNNKAEFATTDNSVFPALIANGITTVQDLGSNCAAIKSSTQRVQRNQVLGPRIFSTCEIIDGPNSGFQTVKRIGNPNAVENEIQKLMAQGVNKIKVHLQLSRQVFNAITASCRRNNIMVGGHVPDAVNVREAVSRMDYIEHMSRLDNADNNLVRAIGNKKMFVTGTLIQGPTRDRLQLANRLRKAGAQMLCGTDLPQGAGLCPNGATHTELKLMVQGGFTPLQALQTATTNAYRSLNMLSKLGTIETGKLADMVLLRKNPVQNINNINTIAGVVTNGKLFPQAELNKMLRNADVVNQLPFACGRRNAVAPRAMCCSV